MKSREHWRAALLSWRWRFSTGSLRPQALIVFSRVGVYERLPGVDVDRFAESMQSGGLMGYIDALSGGSISKVGVFSLGAP